MHEKNRACSDKAATVGDDMKKKEPESIKFKALMVFSLNQRRLDGDNET